MITKYSPNCYLVLLVVARSNHICDVMAQNQSHVTKHKKVQICILSENVKMCQFFSFIKNTIFVQVSAKKIDFLAFLLDFSCIFFQI